MLVFINGHGVLGQASGMARIAGVVVPGRPHLVTQRGNRRQETFFEDDDYRTYMELMAQWSAGAAWKSGRAA